ncbi:MAG: dihydroneopterin aldolase [Lewinella sp.]
MTAKIGLEDVRFHAPHGFFDEEQVMGNEFSIDVEVEAMIVEAAEYDDLGGTVNYATIYYLLQAEMKKPTRLLEALAHRMAGRIMNQFDGVQSVRLKIRKLHPPLGGRVGAAFVEVNLSGDTPGMAAVPGQHTFEDDPDDYDDPGFGGGGNFDFSKFNL